MKDEEFIDKLKSIISLSEQGSIFGNSNYVDKIMEESIKYLRYKGFKITEPKKFDIKIKNIDDLIKYFYLLLNSKHPDNYMMSYNKNKDRGIAKRFVTDRMAAGNVSKEYALNECGEIIKTVFENEDEFKFKYAITFSIFGQSNCKWITDKALQIMNKTLRKKEEESAEALINEIISEQDDSDLGFDDLDELLAKMED